MALLRLGIITFLLTLILNSLWAQNTIKGSIKEEGVQLPVVGAQIILLSADGSIVGYNSSDTNGAFTIELPKNNLAIKLQIQALGYKKLVMDLPSSEIFHSIVLQSAPVALREIIVKAPPIIQRSDTISYDVSHFTGNTDRVIGDVLKKMPGIEVTETGAVLYNGVAINKFYIEGLNLLEGRYGIAVENISAKDIDKVEVLENHQPIKALSDHEFSDRAAINLKLKNSAKARWINQLSMAVGAPGFLWEMQSNSMLFKEKRQSLIVVNTNNTGRDLSRSLEDQTLDGLKQMSIPALQTQDAFSIQTSVPPLKKERYLFNKSVLVSVNDLRPLKHDFTQKINLNFFKSHQTQQQHLSTSYFIPDSNTIHILETTSLNSGDNMLMAEINTVRNTDKNFINNTTSFKGQWKNTELFTIGTQQNEQKATLNNAQFENDFQWLRNLGGTIVRFQSLNHFHQLPQYLNILQDKTSHSNQRVDNNSLYSSSTISIGQTHGKWSFDGKGIFEFSRQQQNSTLRNFTAQWPADSLINKVTWNIINPSIESSIQYRGEKFRMKAELPLHFYLTQYSRTKDRQTNFNRFIPEPAVYLNYNLNLYWKINASAGLGGRIGSLDDLNTALLLKSYRILQIGASTPSIRKTRKLGFGISYRQPVEYFFIHANINYSSTESNYSNKTAYQGILQINNKFKIPNTSTLFNIDGKISKGIDLFNSILSFHAQYNVLKNQFFLLEQFVKSNNKRISIAPAISLKFNKSIQVEYNSTYAWNKLFLEQAYVGKFLHSREENIKLSSSFKDRLILAINLDHQQNQLTTNQTASGWFLDLSTRYVFSKSMDFTLECRNLLNNNSLGYVQISPSYIISNTYNIRPINVLLGLNYRW